MRLTDEQRLKVEYNRGWGEALVKVGLWLQNLCPKLVDADGNYRPLIYHEDIWELTHGRMPSEEENDN